jgi:hypothetical protein
LTIQRISNRQATPLAAARFSSARTVKLPKFAVDEPLTQAASGNVAPASSNVTPRPLVGASQSSRQIAAVPDRASAAHDPIAPSVTSTATKNTTDLSNSPLLASGQARPFYVTNSNFNPADVNSPETIQDPTATAAPQLVQWTSPNGLITTGVMNPFGLTQNNPGMGFYGAPSTQR